MDSTVTQAAATTPVAARATLAILYPAKNDTLASLYIKKQRLAVLKKVILGTDKLKDLRNPKWEKRIQATEIALNTEYLRTLGVAKAEAATTLSPILRKAIMKVKETLRKRQIGLKEIFVLMGSTGICAYYRLNNGTYIMIRFKGNTNTPIGIKCLPHFIPPRFVKKSLSLESSKELRHKLPRSMK